MKFFLGYNESQKVEFEAGCVFINFIFLNIEGYILPRFFVGAIFFIIAFVHVIEIWDGTFIGVIGMIE